MTEFTLPPHWANSVSAVRYPALHTLERLNKAMEAGRPLTPAETAAAAGTIWRLLNMILGTLPPGRDKN